MHFATLSRWMWREGQDNAAPPPAVAGTTPPQPTTTCTYHACRWQCSSCPVMFCVCCWSGMTRCTTAASYGFVTLGSICRVHHAPVSSTVVVPVLTDPVRPAPPVSRSAAQALAPGRCGWLAALRTAARAVRVGVRHGMCPGLGTGIANEVAGTSAAVPPCRRAGI